MIALRFGRRTALVIGLVSTLVGASCASHPVAPATPGAPRYPDYPVPEVPPQTSVAQAVRERHDAAWRALQAGDVRAAEREFTRILRQVPTFYPSETGLGFALLAGKQFKQADTRFAAALRRNERYVPALAGQAEAAIALENEAVAIAALERILVIEPRREAVRARLDLLKFRQLQALIDAGRRARVAGKLDEAQVLLERALGLSASSAIILRELAQTEVARGALVPAEAHARRATEVDAADAEGFVLLSSVLEARGRLREAAAAMRRAATLDAKPEWKTRAEDLADRADMAALPAEYRALPSATTVSRAVAAAYVGIRLESVIDRAPRKALEVITDVRNHWAVTWILPVTQTGVMDILPNHTFQPAAVVRRADLAQMVSALLSMASPSRSADLARWRSARPRFTDLAPGHVFYPAAAIAVASGAMSADADKFNPTRPASGPDLIAAVARIERLSPR